MKVAIYTRVSTMEQVKKGYSIGQQKDRLTQYAEMRDWKVHKVYEDGGWSGTNTNRPALQELLRDCEKGRFERVIVFKLDRLSRSVPKTYELFEYFEKHNVKFVSVTEGFDTSTAYGKAMSGFLAVIAQMENSMRVERSAEGKLGKVKRGEPMTGHNPPFGYDYDKKGKEYTVNPIQANVVTEIYYLYSKGLGGTSIVAELNAKGHIGKPVPWNRTHVRNILTNVIYIGKQRYKGVVYDANHEPIISQPLFKEVQRQRKKREVEAYKDNNPRPWKSKYILSGLLKCGECGDRMELKVARWMNKDGTRKSNDTYRCVNSYLLPREKKDPTRFQCNQKKFSRKELEEIALREVASLRLSDVKPSNPNGFKLDYEEEKSRFDVKKNKLKHLYLEDLISFEDMKKETDQLKASLEELRGLDDEDIEESKDEEEIKQLISNGINFSGISMTDTKVILNTLIDYISLNEDDIIFYWNF